MGFRENLKSELSFQGILVKELSLKTGINKRTLDNYLREKGNIPPADIAVKIADALNVSVEFLVTGTEKRLNLETSETFSADIRQMARKISEMTENEKNLVRALVDEIVRQNSPEENLAQS
ncbi:helix-turn-helix transcriptional regulator [uncultured Treponema sp.]|uniref:helix-turn-helix domain-containing protein n=1 Tax=uncultured Treponema sp. TaxID=162155 RepID=UPI0025CEDDAF|nr:helix-turn-helix transcriptional regulator [uncultured Treponema sp.]